MKTTFCHLPTCSSHRISHPGNDADNGSPHRWDTENNRAVAPLLVDLFCFAVQSDWERKRWAVIRKGDRVRIGRMDRGRKHDVVGNYHRVKTEGLAPLHQCLKGLGGRRLSTCREGKTVAQVSPFTSRPRLWLARVGLREIKSKVKQLGGRHIGGPLV